MHSFKNASPITPASPSALKAWFLAARPKTLIAGISPVLIGTALAAAVQPIQVSLFVLTLLFSVLIQIGTNFANDYFDYINGADTSERKGPKRAVEQGWISPIKMLLAALFSFGAALLIALPLMILAGWWSYLIAAAAILFGICYTGGPKPLGYLGLGELLVFIFYGPVAVCGTFFLQTFSFPFSIFLASLAPGLLSCAILIANNLRDEETDRKAKKYTLVVRWGRFFGSWEYILSLFMAAAIPFLLVIFYNAPILILSASLIFPISLLWILKIFRANDLLFLLPKTALLLLIYTILFCSSLLW